MIVISRDRMFENSIAPIINCTNRVISNKQTVFLHTMDNKIETKTESYVMQTAIQMLIAIIGKVCRPLPIKVYPII